jgi:hypothetical protein
VYIPEMPFVSGVLGILGSRRNRAVFYMEGLDHRFEKEPTPGPIRWSFASAMARGCHGPRKADHRRRKIGSFNDEKSSNDRGTPNVKGRCSDFGEETPIAPVPESHAGYA